MTNGQKVVEVARMEIGTKEVPDNSNEQKYGEWFGFNGVHWCAIFVSWCYHHAGIPFPKVGWPKGMAGCQAAVLYFRKSGEITTDPKPGDVVFFDWDANGRFDHTGIFVGWIDKNYFESIEGNTGLANQSNGGEVMLRKRLNKNVVFVHPKVLDNEKDITLGQQAPEKFGQRGPHAGLGPSDNLGNPREEVRA